jgi:ABC-2 type transport system ATP-binding protein
VAVNNLDLVVEPGRVHGFLGPNGSGKTTTIRALLGLVMADAGVMRIFGEEVPDRLPKVIGQVGAVVESPQFFPYFSGRRNLRLLAGVAGVKRRRVDEVLETVGLRDRADDGVKGYSLGMKQRLAIAATLLKDPKLLILDEPNNGLDPAGIREVRDLMRSLADSGVTVLVSSHILSEIQQVCDAVSIISRGSHVITGPVSEVIASRDTHDVRVKVSDLAQAATLLEESGLPIRRESDHIVVSDIADPAWITQTLARRRLFVSELTPVAPDLESIFLELTGTTPIPGQRLQLGEAVPPPPEPKQKEPVTVPAADDVISDADKAEKVEKTGDRA